MIISKKDQEEDVHRGKWGLTSSDGSTASICVGEPTQ